MANPLKGPFKAMALEWEEQARAALDLARLAGVLPAFLVDPENAGEAVALTAAAGFGIRYYGTGRTCRTSPQRYSWARGELPWDHRQPWTRLGSSNSFGRNYICPSDQVEPFDQDTQAEAVLFNFSAVGARTQAARAERQGAGGQGQADTTVHGPWLQL